MAQITPGRKENNKIIINLPGAAKKKRRNQPTCTNDPNAFWHSLPF